MYGIVEHLNIAHNKIAIKFNTDHNFAVPVCLHVLMWLH